MRRLLLLTAAAVLAFPGAAAAGLEEEAVRLAALADEDTAWVQANADDNLDHEASLAEPAGEAHELLGGFNTRQQADWPLWDVNRALDELVAANSELHRLMVYWADVQPTGPDEWRWGAYDAVVRSAATRGIPLLLAPTGSPNWARAPDRRTAGADSLHPFPYPDDLRAWETFVFQLARRYAHYAVAYHPWNEPNIKEFWLPAQHRQPGSSRRLSPSVYEELYCRAARRIRLADRDGLVGLGGLGPITGQGINWQAGRYLKRLYEVGIADCGVDFVAYHPYLMGDYCDGNDPALDDDRPVNRQLRRMRGVLIEHGHEDRAIWMTEWGFPSSTCGYTEERQDALSARQYDYLSTLPYVSHALWFNPRDTNGTDRWAYIGVLRPDWVRKPVFDTLAALS